MHKVHTESNQITAKSSRLKFAGRYAGTHLLVTLAIAIIVGVLVFFIWYPKPFREMTGGLGLYKLILGIDIVCGPLLTFILASPKKTHKAMLVDISLIACIQLSALGYGLYSVAQARPVALVFEYNRFRLVNYASIVQSDLKDALPQYQSIPWHRIETVGLKEIKTGEEQQANMKRFWETGAEMGMFPDYWIPYQDVKQQVWDTADAMSKLTNLTLKQQEKLKLAIEKSGKTKSQIRYAPMFTPMSDDWIVLLEAGGNIVGYANVSGW